MDNNNKDKGSLMTKFLKVFTLSVVVFSLIVGTATGAYMLISAKDKKTSTTSGSNLNTPTDPTTDDPNKTANGKPQEKVKQVTNFAIFGVDKDGYRTDVVMIATLNHVTNDVNIVSIPRDTGVTLPTDMYNEMRSRGKKIGKEMAINVVPSYSLSNDRNPNSVRALEENFGIDIDYYMNVNLGAFRKIIDIVGPIEFNVPKALKYKDPEQDFYVNIKAGLQSFNGAKAEELIRWRKGNNGEEYADGDIGRIRMQQAFLVEVLKEVLGERNKMNLLRIGTVALDELTTDFDKLINYLPYLEGLTVDKITFLSLEGKWNSKKQLYEIDKEKARTYFKSKTTIEQPAPTDTTETKEPETESSEQTPEKPEAVSSKNLKIQVLNGTGEGGLAGRTQKILQGEGYNVPTVGNYNSRPKRTLIIIPNEGMGEDLITYFDKPEIKLQPENLPEGVDIQIIVGMADKSAY